MKVFVAAPFEDAAFVREHVHERLCALSMTPVSRWVHEAAGPEDFSRHSPERLRRIAEQNDHDLRVSDALLLIARHGASGESFAEARMALAQQKPVVWCGQRLTLSAWRDGVRRVADLDEALGELVVVRAEVEARRAGLGHEVQW